jgi:predicted DCC family thiol-disulfide oxidoreductase YuxK/uncharacterized membrane protein YphA (DoxX/SURF4 family)
MNVLSNIWKKYWFRPAPLIDLAICRILIVGFQLSNLLVWHSPMYKINRLGRLPDYMYRPLPVLNLLNWPLGKGFRPPADLVEIIYWVTLAAGMLALIGWKTNPSLAVFAVGNVYIYSFVYSFREYHHPEAILLLTLSILALSPAGGVLSLDDLIKRRREAVRNRRFEEANISGQIGVFSRWPLLLIQWLFALVYMSSAYSKLANAGLDWINGYTLQYDLAMDGMRRGIPLGQWASQFHLFAQLGSTVVLLFQLTFFIVLIFPVLAILYLPVGVTFHSLVYLLLRAPFFIWMALYVVFIPWSKCLALLQRSRSSSGKSLEVLYDGECPLCLRSMTLINYFDGLHRLRYTDVTKEWSRVAEFLPGKTKEDCLREMYVLLPDGSAPSGYFAFREIVWKIPPFWPLLILFYLPLSSSVGPKIYRFIASRRLRFGHCESDACLQQEGL